MAEPAPQLSLHSPVGDLTVSGLDGVIVSLDWGWAPRQASSPLLENAKAQLDAYFDAERSAFELPLEPPGTEFQRRVWRALAAIPYGATLSYGALAARLGCAPRPVGAACGRNPIPIFIPCHRIVAGDGGLGGYSGDGGAATKRALLALEAAQALLPLEDAG